LEKNFLFFLAYTFEGFFCALPFFLMHTHPPLAFLEHVHEAWRLANAPHEADCERFKFFRYFK
jgi:hypothetical protein